MRLNSALSRLVIPAAKRIGHRHQSVMLVSRTAAPRSAINRRGVCRCAMWLKLSNGTFVPAVLGQRVTLQCPLCPKEQTDVRLKFGRAELNARTAAKSPQDRSITPARRIAAMDSWMVRLYLPATLGRRPYRFPESEPDESSITTPPAASESSSSIPYPSHLN
jgi:hypothetical protein